MPHLGGVYGRELVRQRGSISVLLATQTVAAVPVRCLLDGCPAAPRRLSSSVACCCTACWAACSSAWPKGLLPTAAGPQRPGCR